MLNTGSTVLTAQPTPEMPEKPSAVYEVYAGKSPAQTLSNQSNSVQVTLKNENLKGLGRRLLVITVAAQG
jgi:hypothetical protein